MKRMLLLALMIAIGAWSCFDAYDGRYLVAEVRADGMWRAYVTASDAVHQWSATMVGPLAQASTPAFPGLEYELLVVQTGNERICLYVHLSPATTLEERCGTERRMSIAGKLPVPGV